MMKQYKLLWKRLKLIRRGRLDLTQLQVAQRMGVSRNSYADYEAGRAEPKPHNLVKLVEMFGQEVYKEC